MNRSTFLKILLAAPFVGVAALQSKTPAPTSEADRLRKQMARVYRVYGVRQCVEYHIREGYLLKALGEEEQDRRALGHTPDKWLAPF